ncbi:MAG: RDD family protein [Pseudomonadota bacterium]
MTDIAADKARRAALARRVSRQKESEREAKRIRQLITPEGATLNLRIASAGERAGALFIDLALMLVAALIALFGIGWVITGLGYEGWRIANAVFLLIIFGLRVFYFMGFELGRRAATPGKRALGLRVAARDGSRLTANSVIVRNFMRELEVFLPVISLIVFTGSDQNESGWINLLIMIWAMIFMLFPIFNREKLRAGDLIAGTMVIHAPKVQLLKDITAKTKQQDVEDALFTPAQLDVYGIHELHVLEDVLRQSTSDIRKTVASRIQKKIAWDGPPLNELDFLERFYAALRKHLEQRMLFGERKEDKFDRS